MNVLVTKCSMRGDVAASGRRKERDRHKGSPSEIGLLIKLILNYYYMWDTNPLKLINSLTLV